VLRCVIFAPKTPIPARADPWAQNPTLSAGKTELCAPYIW
jgi:hypothetical protein